MARPRNTDSNRHTSYYELRPYPNIINSPSCLHVCVHNYVTKPEETRDLSHVTQPRASVNVSCSRAGHSKGWVPELGARTGCRNWDRTRQERGPGKASKARTALVLPGHFCPLVPSIMSLDVNFDPRTRLSYITFHRM